MPLRVPERNVAVNTKDAVHNPIAINPETCVRCDLCDWICPGDIIYKEEDNRETLPVIAYPDECWYCGLCESICPTDAITVVFPEQMVHNKTDVVSLLGRVVD
jgi:formate hydrogenlyase subunit 6/NADH:ubiquinone oxidoreductase subunit I